MRPSCGVQDWAAWRLVAEVRQSLASGHGWGGGVQSAGPWEGLL